MPIKNFKIDTVLDLCKRFKKAKIQFWLDGGWGVDALLGKQTRSHTDLDIVIQEDDVTKLRSLFNMLGYKEIYRDDTSLWNFVLCDNLLNEVDIHVISFDQDGNGVYGPLERGVFYPADSLKGIGCIQSMKVNCLTPEYQLVSHSGYQLKEKDYMDIKSLCSKFGLKYSDQN